MLSGPQHIESLTKPSNYIPVNPPDSQSSKEGNLVSRAFPLENGNEVVRDEHSLKKLSVIVKVFKVLHLSLFSLGT